MNLKKFIPFSYCIVLTGVVECHKCMIVYDYPNNIRERSGHRNEIVESNEQRRITTVT